MPADVNVNHHLFMLLLENLPRNYLHHLPLSIYLFPLFRVYECLYQSLCFFLTLYLPAGISGSPGTTYFGGYWPHQPPQWLTFCCFVCHSLLLPFCLLMSSHPSWLRQMAALPDLESDCLKGIVRLLGFSMIRALWWLLLWTVCFSTAIVLSVPNNSKNPGIMATTSWI